MGSRPLIPCRTPRAARQTADPGTRTRAIRRSASPRRTARIRVALPGSGQPAASPTAAPIRIRLGVGGIRPMTEPVAREQARAVSRPHAGGQSANTQPWVFAIRADSAGRPVPAPGGRGVSARPCRRTVPIVSTARSDRARRAVDRVVGLRRTRHVDVDCRPGRLGPAKPVDHAQRQAVAALNRVDSDHGSSRSEGRPRLEPVRRPATGRTGRTPAIDRAGLSAGPGR
jgi:hypothetical protein